MPRRDDISEEDRVLTDKQVSHWRAILGSIFGWRAKNLTTGQIEEVRTVIQKKVTLQSIIDDNERRWSKKDDEEVTVRNVEGWD